MIFKDPWVLLLIPLVVMALLWLRRRQRPSAVRFPSAELFSGVGSTWKSRLAGIPFGLRIITLCLILAGLAGPRSILDEIPHESEGIDIVMAIDVSGSMAAEDFAIKGRRANRLEVVKNVVAEFVEGRRSDRIGLVAFAGLAYTASPLTTDTNWLRSIIEKLQLNIMEDGTAIGSALAASVSRLEKSPAKSRVVVLLTDGVNNRGAIDPLTAAKAAAALGIKVYTIGAGTMGMAPFPVQDIWGRRGYQNVAVEIDERTLREISDLTGGRYYRAKDTDSLRQIYQEIDRLEKAKIEQTGYREYRELFGYFLIPAMILLTFAVMLENSVLLKLP